MRTKRRCPPNCRHNMFLAFRCINLCVFLHTCPQIQQFLPQVKNTRTPVSPWAQLQLTCSSQQLLQAIAEACSSAICARCYYLSLIPLLFNTNVRRQLPVGSLELRLEYGQRLQAYPPPPPLSRCRIEKRQPLLL